MKEKFLKAASKGTAFKIVFMMLTLISFNGLFARRDYLTYIAYVVAAFGAVTLFVRLICFKKYIHAKGVFLLVAFCGSYALSALLTREYGLGGAVKALVWMALQYFVLYAYDRADDIKSDRRELDIISHVFMVYTLFAAGAGVVMLFTDYYSYTPLDGANIIMGFLWNRLWGVYTDPNYGAVFSVIAIIMGLYYFKKAQKPVKVFYIINMILQVGYIAFSDSRTGLVALAGTMFVYIYLVVLRTKKVESKKMVVKGLICIVLAGVVAVGSVAVVKTLTTSTSAFKKWQYENRATQSDSTKTAAQIEKEKQKLEIGRQSEDINGDVSNRRFAIWQSGFDIFKSKPLTGVTFRNFVAYSKDKLPDTYIINNDFGDFASMHNSAVDILASQGIIGVVIIAAYVILIFIEIFKKFFKFRGEDYKYNTFLLCIIVPIFITMMVYSETFYMNTCGAFLFWLSLGYLMHSLSTMKVPSKSKKKKSRSIETAN